MVDIYRPPRQIKAEEITMTPGQTATFIGTIALIGLGAFLVAREIAGKEGFTVILVNYPEPINPDNIAKFNDGIGDWIPCGQPGKWLLDTGKTEYQFTIYVYEWAGDTMKERLGFYAFRAQVEQGHDYIYDCATGEFYKVW